MQQCLFYYVIALTMHAFPAALLRITSILNHSTVVNSKIALRVGGERGLGLAVTTAVPSWTGRYGPHPSIMPLLRQVIPQPLMGIPLWSAVGLTLLRKDFLCSIMWTRACMSKTAPDF